MNLLLICCLCLPTLGNLEPLGTDADRLEIEMVYKVASQQNAPFLESLVRVQADPDGIWPFLRSVRVPVAEDGLISRGVVLDRIVAAGVPTRAFDLIGPALVRIERRP